MTGGPRIALIDDLRSFVDGRPAEVARTSAAGAAWIAQALRRWDYPVRVATGSAEVGYLG